MIEKTISRFACLVLIAMGICSIVGETDAQTGPSNLAEGIQAEMPLLQPEVLSASELHRLLQRPHFEFPRLFDTAFDSPRLHLVTTRIVDSPPSMTYQLAMDRIAQRILKVIQEGDLIVALVLDGSESPRFRSPLVREMGRMVSDLSKRSKPSDLARLKWSLVRYRYRMRPEVMLQPTSAPEEMLQRAETSGEFQEPEGDVFSAISFTVRNIAPLGMRLFVVVLRDEEGWNQRDDQAYQQALQNLQAAHAELFAFGKEALFQRRCAVDWVRDSRDEKISTWFWDPRGIESCEQEFFEKDWVFNPYPKNSPVGSGFGCWSMTTLAKFSNGEFFVLRLVPSPYDDDRISRFKPEWIGPREYKQRNAESPIRTAISKSVATWRTLCPPSCFLMSEKPVEKRDEAIAKAEKAEVFVHDAIGELEGLREKRCAEKYASLRWQANYDLVLAELYKFRFLVGEYLAVLRETQTAGFPRYTSGKKLNCYRVLYNPRLTEPRTGHKGKQHWGQAIAAFDQIVKEYSGTPWAAEAKSQEVTTAPIWIIPDSATVFRRVRDSYVVENPGADNKLFGP